MWILEWIVVAGLGACVSLHCKHKVLFFLAETLLSRSALL